MANKREFKKQADALGAAVIDEMISVYYNVDADNRDKIAKAIEKVLLAVGTAKNNSNRYFDRGPRSFENNKEYDKAKHQFYHSLFDKINADFTEGLDEALKLFNEALPASEKVSNKELVNQ